MSVLFERLALRFCALSRVNPLCFEPSDPEEKRIESAKKSNRRYVKTNLEK